MSVSDNTQQNQQDQEEKQVSPFKFIYKKYEPSNYTYDFLSYDNEFMATCDIVTHIIVFRRNDDYLPLPKDIKIVHSIFGKEEEEDMILSLKINWDKDGYGLVDFSGKYLNIMKMQDYKVKTGLSKNYKLFIRSVYLQPEERKLFKKEPIFIKSIESEREEIYELKYVNYIVSCSKDESIVFNAVRFDNLESFKLKMFGITRLGMKKTALIAYKKYVNDKYFLLSPKMFDLDNINPIFRKIRDASYLLYRKGNDDQWLHQIEFESVIKL